MSARHFDSWWKKARRETPQLLTFTEDLLTRTTGETVSTTDYPTTWRQGGLELPVTYQFEPGAAADGVTVHIPVQVLNQVVDDGFDWQVPGLRAELATALLKSLPKSTRRHFVPTPDHAAAALADAQPGGDRRLTDELSRVLHARTGVRVPDGEWTSPESRPPEDHLQCRRRPRAGPRHGEGPRQPEGPDGRPGAAPDVASGSRDRAKRPVAVGLRATAGDVRDRVGRPAGAGLPGSGRPRRECRPRRAAGEREARAATRLGVRRLLLLNTTAPWKRVLARLTNAQKLALGNNPHGTVPALLEDCLACAVDAIVAERAPGSVRDAETFEDVLAGVRTHAATRVLGVIDEVEPVLSLAREVEQGIGTLTAPPVAAMAADLRAQLGSLVYAGFVADTGLSRLPHLRRYLRAMLQRIEKAPGALARDAQSQETVDRVEEAYADLLDSLAPVDRRSEPVREVGWMVEELRVSLFANSLGTAYPVSEKRIRKALDSLAR